MKYILPFLIALLLFSCSSKKKLTFRESEKKSHVENKDVVLSTTDVSNTHILTDSTAKRTVYTPIDPDKPSRVGNTTFENTTIIQEDVALKKKETKKDSAATALEDHSSEFAKESRSSRNTDTKATRQSPWAWFAVAGGVVLIVVFWIRFGHRYNKLK